MAATNDGTDPKLWMTALQPTLRTRRLYDICIVGTHDTGTYAMVPGSAALSMGPACDGEDPAIAALTVALQKCTQAMTAKVVLPWARTQSFSVKGQLERGVRFLDIRLGIYPGMTPLEYRQKMKDNSNFVPAKEEIWTCHTVWGSPWSEVVNDIAAFFNELPEGHVETLIVDMQSMDGFDHVRHYQQLVDSLAPIAPWLIRGDANLDGPLASIWEGQNNNNRQRILLLYREPKTDPLRAAAVPLLLGANCRPRHSNVVSAWPNVKDAGAVVLKALGVICTPEPTRRSSLLVCQGVATPDASQIAASVLQRNSLHDQAAAVNKALLELWEGFTPTGLHDQRNILLLDFFEIGASPAKRSAVEMMIELNRARSADATV